MRGFLFGISAGAAREVVVALYRALPLAYRSRRLSNLLSMSRLAFSAIACALSVSEQARASSILIVAWAVASKSRLNWSTAALLASMACSLSTYSRRTSKAASIDLG